MKIVRYRDGADQIKCAAEGPDGTRREIAGDLFGDYTVTDRPADVRKLLAPVAPAALLCIGLNYKRHALEGHAAIPQYPVLFMKAVTAVQNPGDPIQLPRGLATDEVDYEAELAVVIGKRCKNAPRTAPSTTSSATPAPTTSAPATGRTGRAARSGAAEKRSTPSPRWAPVSSPRTKSPTPTPC